jgi:hypothetical protein
LYGNKVEFGLWSSYHLIFTWLMAQKGVEMGPSPVSLQELDRVEVLTLIDNFVDILLIDQLKALSPAVVVPMHCTGRRAMEQFSREFPSSFVLNSVGSKITLT